MDLIIRSALGQLAGQHLPVFLRHVRRPCPCHLGLVGRDDLDVFRHTDNAALAGHTDSRLDVVTGDHDGPQTGLLQPQDHLSRVRFQTIFQQEKAKKVQFNFEVFPAGQ